MSSIQVNWKLEFRFAQDMKIIYCASSKGRTFHSTVHLPVFRNNYCSCKINRAYWQQQLKKWMLQVWTRSSRNYREVRLANYCKSRWVVFVVQDPNFAKCWARENCQVKMCQVWGFSVFFLHRVCVIVCRNGLVFYFIFIFFPSLLLSSVSLPLHIQD